jgi:hypothetical protein
MSVGPYREPPVLLCEAPRRVPWTIAVRLTLGAGLTQAGWLAIGIALGTLPICLGSNGNFPVAPAFFPALFLVFGMGLAAPGFWRGIGIVRLLKSGRPSVATVTQVAKAFVDIRFGTPTVWRVDFQYEVDGAIYRGSVNTRNAASLMDDAQEQVVYDSRTPQRSTLIDHLPGPPHIDSHGRILGGSVARALAVLVFPVAACVAPAIVVLAMR